MIKNVFIFLLFLTLVSCGSQSENETINTTKKFSEVTAFNPQTGQPLTIDDLSTDLFTNDMDGEGGAILENFEQTNGISETGEVLKRAQDSLLFGWTPTGEYNSYISPQCHYEKLNRIIASETGGAQGLARSVQSWQQQCEEQLSRGHTNNIGILLQFDNVNYDLVRNDIKKLQFEFDNNEVVKGLLALKPGKRPLVIFQTGVFDDAKDGGVVRNYFMNLYDETPFSVLVLGSNTGVEYVKTNHNLTMGGFDEGRQIVKIAQMLSEDPLYKDRIEDIHVVGVSLGSNSALFSSLYNSYEPEGLSKIKSVLAFCPVVNLKPTMESVYKNTPRGIFYGILTNQVLQKVYNDVPGLSQLLRPSLFWTNQEIFPAITNLAVRSYNQKTRDIPWGMAPFQNTQISNIDGVWDFNNFISYAEQVTTPTLVVYAKDDPLVKPSFNSIDLSQSLSGWNSNIGVLSFDNGSHCAFNLGESWPTVSNLIRNYILKNSSYQSTSLQDVVLEPDIPQKSLRERQKITKYVFSVKAKQEAINVKVSVFDGDSIAVGNSRCRIYDNYNGPESCYQSYSYSFDIQKFSTVGVNTPQNDFEAQRLGRWLNTRASLVDQDGSLVLGGSRWPAGIKFHGQFDHSP